MSFRLFAQQRPGRATSELSARSPSISIVAPFPPPAYASRYFHSCKGGRQNGCVRSTGQVLGALTASPQGFRRMGVGTLRSLLLALKARKTHSFQLGNFDVGLFLVPPLPCPKSDRGQPLTSSGPASTTCILCQTVVRGVFPREFYREEKGRMSERATAAAIAAVTADAMVDGECAFAGDSRRRDSSRMCVMEPEEEEEEAREFEVGAVARVDYKIDSKSRKIYKKRVLVFLLYSRERSYLEYKYITTKTYIDNNYRSRVRARPIIIDTKVYINKLKYKRILLLKKRLKKALYIRRNIYTSKLEEPKLEE
ncbi:hypothetical protein JOL62DRAFT_559999 [Phyllosticta paracitricarpa]|uniref:Uncharacterized protein n=1 Tax=Phyllosticta paracitricarpa TaxID=2016321 RepID=A0ABR1MUI5_9PEZI